MSEGHPNAIRPQSKKPIEDDGYNDGVFDEKDVLRAGKHVARFMREHNVLTRLVIAMFLYICWDLNWWIQEMVEADKIKGDVVMSAYVVAMAGGFVAVVNALIKSELDKSKEDD